VTQGSASYGLWITVLSMVSAVCVLGMIWGELTNHRLLGTGFLAVILLAYSFILLFLRKGGWSGV
jgi:hypothetical protein